MCLFCRERIQNPFEENLGARRSRGCGGHFRFLQFVQCANSQEYNERDDQEIYNDGQEIAQPRTAPRFFASASTGELTAFERPRK